MAVPAFTETVHPAFAAPTQGRLTPSPYSFLFTGEDQLRLTVWNSVGGVVVALHYRVDRPGAPTHASRDSHTPTSDRLPSSSEFQIGEGFLLNVAVFCSSGVPIVGQTFVKVEVIRGAGANAIVLGVILQGYISARQPLGWPGSPIANAFDGKGCIRTVGSTTPAAGTAIAETVPTGARWELISMFCRFTTDATVATRCAQLTYFAGAISKGLIADAGSQIASTSIFYQWEIGVNQYAQSLGATHHLSLVPDLHLFAGETFQVTAANLQAGDQFDVVRYTVREWLEAL